MFITQNKKTFLFIILAFLFSVFIRLIWVYHFSGLEGFKFNNEFMINTNDGYYWAEGARDILSNTKGTGLSPINSSASILAAFVTKIFSIKLETVLFYLPAFLSSLIVIPIILIAKLFDELEVGFIAALLSGIAWSYYNRTLVGYYDTDFLNIVLPTFLLWSLIWAIKTSKEEYFFIAAIDSILYRLWYPVSYSLEFAFIATIIIYSIYLKYKNKDIKTNILLITFMLFAMMNLDSWIRFFIVTTLFVLLKINRQLIEKYIYYVLILAIILFFITGGFDPIWDKIKNYIFRSNFKETTNYLDLHFYNVVNTIREVRYISFETFSNRISGSIFGLVIGIVGYILLCIKKPVFLISLPMVGLGFLALSGGLRFTIYALPIMALGSVYFIFVVGRFIASLFSEKVSGFIKYLFILVLSSGILYPNIKHVLEYKVPTVFMKNEVKILDKLKNISKSSDYAISWWDYGYPIRYYSNKKTLLDGGKSGGQDSFLISLMLSSSQEVGAKVARLDVEYTEKRIKLNGDNKSKVKLASSNIEQMTLDYGFNDVNDFLLDLQSDIILPRKTRDIYIYLPNRMLSIFPTVMLFSNIDLMTGKRLKRNFFFQSRYMKVKKNIVELGSNVKLLMDNESIKIGNKNIRVNRFITTVYNKNRKLVKYQKVIDPRSPYNVIYMKNYNKVLIVDEKILNSLFIQLFVFENYDSRYFEPSILSPYVKVYKLKI